MKKFFTLKNIVLFAGALLLLVAFCLSFAATFTFTNGGTTITWFNFVWGVNKSQIGSTVYFDDKAMEPAVFPFVGLILIFVGMIAAVLVVFLVKKPFAKYIVAGCAVVILAGAIMQFIVIASAARAYARYLCKSLNITDKEQIKLVIKQYSEHFKDEGGKSAICVVMGILGILGASAIGVSQFLPEKK